MLAKRLIEHFKSVSKIMNASIEELAEVEGIGMVSAQKIRERKVNALSREGITTIDLFLLRKSERF